MNDTPIWLRYECPECLSSVWVAQSPDEAPEPPQCANDYTPVEMVFMCADTSKDLHWFLVARRRED